MRLRKIFELQRASYSYEIGLAGSCRLRCTLAVVVWYVFMHDVVRVAKTELSQSHKPYRGRDFV